MAQIISTIFDAILANVKLTLVASAANIWKTASRFEAYIFVLPKTKNEENRTMGILGIWV